jgi:hypothetical protein
MGYKIDTNMRVKLVNALEMAVKNRRYKMKSNPSLDRGIQYCCPDFAEFSKSRTLFLVQLKIPAHTKMRSQKELMEY